METKLKQPKGLSLLFFTEMWERFGFYTVQILLILYMTKHLGFLDSRANHLFGAYTGLLYLTPVLGGYIADHYLGFKQCILQGAFFFIVGYLLLSSSHATLFFLGLSFIIIGNGLFKPNVSSLVGALYKRDDPRRDSGFTLFYMGINIGALMPSLIASYSVMRWGWHVGFFFAAIGMSIGLLTFILGRKIVKKVGGVPALSPLKKEGRKVFYTAFYGIILAIILLCNLLFLFPHQTSLIMIFAFVIILGYVFYLVSKSKHDAKNRMFAVLILMLLSIGFWAIYNQMFSSLIFFADRNMSKEIFGMKITTQFMQFFNPLFIILLSPVISRIWLRMESRSHHPSTPTKFSFGILLMGIGFLWLGFGARYFSYNNLASPWVLIVSLFLQTIGELFISPVGLAMITRLCPQKVVGMMMGVWFLMQSASSAIAGELATLADIKVGTTPAESLQIYSRSFLLYGSLAMIVALISFLLIPSLKKLIHNEHLA